MTETKAPVIPTKTGTFLRHERKSKKISQVEVGKKLGYSSQFIANWERGVSMPPFHCLREYCRMLKIDVEEVKFRLSMDFCSKMDREI